MSNASDGNSRYRDNRYSFHLSTSGETAGVPPEFVHQNVLRPVKELLQKTARALSLRPDDADYRNVVELLNNCINGVQNGLDNKIVNQSASVHHEHDEHVTTSQTSLGF
ncbi:hypothetical protein Lmor_2082 [Legionella moravica]|uniref:Dot/Icm secretion system substrate n=1 Tax=Legionella moravica TaxID=39962 RepID=Q49JC8_9GAMM|nr:hypothetical protein [Legionella moravica]AAX56146.1 unknown [Legionella moravica]KTD32653.1 hypothetical protein Lmor_2082 [Legionella moravica]STX61477.1 Uncharacterised protein [Legionella moravica]